MSHPVEIGVVPGPLATRLLVRDGPTTLAKARLPHSPQHPRALLTLAEGVALWTGRPIRVVIAVVGAGAFCATPRWLDTLELVTRPSPVAVDTVRHDAVPADPEPRAGFGAFADVRRLLRRRPLR